VQTIHLVKDQYPKYIGPQTAQRQEKISPDYKMAKDLNRFSQKKNGGQQEKGKGQGREIRR
jgi:hypothetical protein